MCVKFNVPVTQVGCWIEISTDRKLSASQRTVKTDAVHKNVTSLMKGGLRCLFSNINLHIPVLMRYVC